MIPWGKFFEWSDMIDRVMISRRGSSTSRGIFIFQKSVSLRIMCIYNFNIHWRFGNGAEGELGNGRLIE